MNHESVISKLRSEAGQDLVEYVLMVVLIALAASAAMFQLGASASQSYADAASCVEDPTQAGSQGEGGGQGLPGQGKGQGKNNPCPR